MLGNIDQVASVKGRWANVLLDSCVHIAVASSARWELCIDMLAKSCAVDDVMSRGFL